MHRFAVVFFINKKIIIIEVANTEKWVYCFLFLFLAGSLNTLLEQDGCLPESSIRSFGVDICEGLFYSHSMGLLFCDLIPRKVI